MSCNIFKLSIFSIDQPNIPTHSTTSNSDEMWNLESTLGATLPSTSNTNTESVISNHHHHTNSGSNLNNNNGHFDFDLNGTSNNMNDQFPQQFQQQSIFQNAQTSLTIEQQQQQHQEQQTVRKRTPADFLGEHQKLVDLEKLIEKNPGNSLQNCFIVYNLFTCLISQISLV